MQLALDFDIRRNIGFLFNENIFSVVSKNTKILKSIYHTDEKLCNLLDTIEQRTFSSDIDLEIFLRNNLQYSDEDVEIICNDFKRKDDMNQDSEQFILSKLEDIINTALWNEINGRTDLNGTEKIELMNKKCVSLAKQSLLESTIQEGELHELEVDHTFGKPIKSHCNLLNLSSPVGGLLNNTMIALAAAPSAGKSLFLMREAYALARQGRHVLYTALGDLELRDFKFRLYAIINNVSIDSAYIDTRKTEFIIDAQLKALREEFGGSITLQIVPAAVMSVQDYENKLNIKNYRKKCNVFILDYDQNMFSTLEPYEKGREIYNYFAKLSDEKDNIVYVAGQLVKSALSEQIIGMEGLGDSRAKAEIADIVMTFSKDRNKANTTGMITLPKVRRGKEGAYTPYFLDISGRMYELDAQSYSNLVKLGDGTQISYCVEGAMFHQIKKYALKDEDLLSPPENYDLVQCRIMYDKKTEEVYGKFKFIYDLVEFELKRELKDGKIEIVKHNKQPNLATYFAYDDEYVDSEYYKTYHDTRDIVLGLRRYDDDSYTYVKDLEILDQDLAEPEQEYFDLLSDGIGYCLNAEVEIA